VLHLRRSHHHAATTMTPAIAIAETLSMLHLTRRAGASASTRIASVRVAQSAAPSARSPAMGGSTLRSGARTGLGEPEHNHSERVSLVPDRVG
jgi:hypothetical protein